MTDQRTNKIITKPSRFDLYKLIHKAQRAHLFDLASRIGSADFRDMEEAQSIELELRSMIAHLRGHSVTEARFIHPLYQSLGNQISIIDEEHDDLEKSLELLEDILNQKEWEVLYPELNRFIAAYLTHQDEEESMQEKILWNHFDDLTLQTVFIEFQKSRTQAQKTDDLKFFLSGGLSILELEGIFQGIYNSAPKEAFEAVCQIAKTHLESVRWAKLYGSLTTKQEI